MFLEIIFEYISRINLTPKKRYDLRFNVTLPYEHYNNTYVQVPKRTIHHSLWSIDLGFNQNNVFLSVLEIQFEAKFMVFQKTFLPQNNRQNI